MNYHNLHKNLNIKRIKTVILTLLFLSTLSFQSCCYFPLVDCPRFYEFQTLENKSYYSLKIHSDTLRIKPFIYGIRKNNERDLFEMYIAVEYQADSLLLNSGLIDRIELYSLVGNEKYKFIKSQEKNKQVNPSITEKLYFIETGKRKEKKYEKILHFSFENVETTINLPNVTFKQTKYDPFKKASP